MSGADGEHDAGGSVTDSTATLVNEHLLEVSEWLVESVKFVLANNQRV
jgi:hypothetical protein